MKSCNVFSICLGKDRHRTLGLVGVMRKRENTTAKEDSSSRDLAFAEGAFKTDT